METTSTATSPEKQPQSRLWFRNVTHIKKKFHLSSLPVLIWQNFIRMSKVIFSAAACLNWTIWSLLTWRKGAWEAFPLKSCSVHGNEVREWRGWGVRSTATSNAWAIRLKGFGIRAAFSRSTYMKATNVNTYKANAYSWTRCSIIKIAVL